MQEKGPLSSSSLDALLPLTEQKGKHFETKFTTEDHRTFWYQHEKEIVSYMCVIPSEVKPSIAFNLHIDNCEPL